jgi:GAF domain-containing protein
MGVLLIKCPVTGREFPPGFRFQRMMPHAAGRALASAFARVAQDGASACGRAFRAQEAVVIEDVEIDPDYAPFIEVARHAGYRSVVSVPLISARNALVGVLSVHSSAR